MGWDVCLVNPDVSMAIKNLDPNNVKSLRVVDSKRL